MRALLERLRRHAERRLVDRIDAFTEALAEASDEDLGRLLALAINYRNDALGKRRVDLLDPAAALAADPRLRKWVEREERLSARVGQPLVALSIGVWVRTLDGTASPAVARAVRDMWSVLDRGREHTRRGAEQWAFHTGMSLDLTDLERLPPPDFAPGVGASHRR